MIDNAIVEFDRALRTVFAPAQSVRQVPGADLPEADLAQEARRHAAALMRVNHVGEICAQALYQGQAMMSQDPAIRDALRATGGNRVQAARRLGIARATLYQKLAEFPELAGAPTDRVA